jgi:Restriction endonuclease NotI
MSVQNPPKHPLAEVFGFPPAASDPSATRHRTRRLCPFNNKVPNCTKDKAQDPLGVCSVLHGEEIAITCPVRFRQNWLIADHAADFFFPPGINWTTLTEVRLKDADGSSAGNIDVVLCAYDEDGRVYDFGALEVQAVYISGNVRNPFAHYMGAPAKRAEMDWTQEANYPRPDYLSSSRKRLAPQLLFKGGILHAWKKKSAVAIDRAFFATLPEIPCVPREQSDFALLVYELLPPTMQNVQYQLSLAKTVYTSFAQALSVITTPRVGRIEEFIRDLQSKVDEKLEHAPINRTIENPFDR